MTGTRSARAYLARKQAGEAIEPQPATTPPTSGIPPKRTAEEQEILNLVEREKGKAYTERHAELILEQARSVGML